MKDGKKMMERSEGQKTGNQEKLTEDRIKQLEKDYLISKGGWREDGKETGLHEHGVDLKLTNEENGDRFFIECKAKSYAKSARSINNEGWLNALGQLVTRMESKRIIETGEAKGSINCSDKYGLGLYWVGAQVALRRIPHEIARVMNLYIFSVDDDGYVVEWSPSEVGKDHKEKEFHRGQES